MKYSGYWVVKDIEAINLERTDFDDTELDPASNWTQAWQNQDCESPAKGYVEITDALICVATLVAKNEQRILNKSELDKAMSYVPEWRFDRCEIKSLGQILGESD